MKLGIIILPYYMAGCASGQDEQNPALSLATRAGTYLARSRLPAVFLQEKFSVKLPHQGFRL